VYLFIVPPWPAFLAFWYLNLLHNFGKPRNNNNHSFEQTLCLRCLADRELLPFRSPGLFDVHSRLRLNPTSISHLIDTHAADHRYLVVLMGLVRVEGKCLWDALEAELNNRRTFP
jgi:hypothetical protein